MEIKDKLRPFYIAEILYGFTDEEHSLSTMDIVRILEEKYQMSVNRLTVKKDISLLVTCGMDIQEIKSTQNRYNLVSRLFDISELKMLIDAVESSKFITKKKSEALVSKLCKLASNYCSEDLKRNLFVEGRIKAGNEKIYMIVDVINSAINQHKKISFYYFQYDKNKKQKLKHNNKPFLFSPLYLVWNGDYYYVVGVFDEEDKIGSFRVDRIAKCPEILNETANKAPDCFDINEYINTTFRMYDSSRSNVELICDNSVMDAIIDKFGKNVNTYKNDENTFIAEVNIGASHIFYSWIFGFCGLVRIKSPESVKNEYMNMLNNAVDNIKGKAGK